MSATRTVQLALGASRDNISAQLSLSSATTQSVTVGCTSPAMTAGTVWTAWPRGNLWQHRINKRVHEKGSDGMDYGGETSGPLKAFDPRGPESLADSDENLETRLIDAGYHIFCDRQLLYKNTP